MSTKLGLASQYWNEGVTPENICRLAHITSQQLYRFITHHPNLFQRLGSGDSPKPAHQESLGKLTPKVKGTHGIPKSLILKGQCCFPLWDDAEQPSATSLMCGEPTADDKQYCAYHHKICCLTVAAESSLEGQTP